MKKLPCQAVKDLYPTVKDGCAHRETAELVKEHLEACPDCRAFYKERRIVSGGTSQTVPGGDFGAVARRIRIRNTVCAALVSGAVLSLAVYAFFGKKR